LCEECQSTWMSSVEKCWCVFSGEAVSKLGAFEFVGNGITIQRRGIVGCSASFASETCLAAVQRSALSRLERFGRV
jgi:hypothetical protein